MNEYPEAVMRYEVFISCIYKRRGIKQSSGQNESVDITSSIIGHLGTSIMDTVMG